MVILRSLYRILIDLVETFVIAGAIFVVVYAFLFRPFQVNGQSMFPNYKNGEYILTNLIALQLSPIRRGEVVVFKSPENKEKDFIKRVIGMPGDTVMVKEGYVYVNGQKLDEAYLPSDFRTYPGAFLTEGREVTVPEDNYIFLGDNRDFSSDSREWGFVSKDKLIGKSFFVYWPLSEMKLIEGAKYE